MSELLLKDKLRELRTSMHYTQHYVAQYLNMTRQGYAHYEAGLRTPDYKTLLKLSNLYQVDINILINNYTTPIEHITLHDNEGYLINKNNQIVNQSQTITIPLSCDEIKLFNLYRKLSDYDKKYFLFLLDNKVNELE